MMPRQTPRQWLVAADRLGGDLCRAAGRLPRGSGILLVGAGLSAAEARRLRRIARTRGLMIADESRGDAARVHNARQVRRSAGVPLLFLSPIFPTRSHPDWAPLPRMRAAALLRLASVPVIALGGMNRRRFDRVERLGFKGWAGIDAWLSG
jgi:thiamine-phosphate pyrophosphorylase